MCLRGEWGAHKDLLTWQKLLTDNKEGQRNPVGYFGVQLSCRKATDNDVASYKPNSDGTAL